VHLNAHTDLSLKHLLHKRNTHIIILQIYLSFLNKILNIIKIRLTNKNKTNKRKNMSVNNQLIPYTNMSLRDLAGLLVDDSLTSDQRSLVASAVAIKNIQITADQEQRVKFIAKQADKNKKEMGGEIEVLRGDVALMGGEIDTLTAENEKMKKTFNGKEKEYLKELSKEKMKKLQCKATAARVSTATAIAASTATIAGGFVGLVACPPSFPITLSMMGGGFVSLTGSMIGHACGTEPYAADLEDQKWVLEEFPESQRSADVKTRATAVRSAYSEEMNHAHSVAYRNLNDNTDSQRQAEMDREYNRLSTIAWNNLCAAKNTLRAQVDIDFYL